MSPAQFTQGIKDSASGSIISLPGKGGTFALTSDIPVANSGTGTTALTSLKIGDTIYSIPKGDVTAAGKNTFTGSNWFTGMGSVLTTQHGIRIGFSNGLSPDAGSSIYSIDKYGFYGLGENGSTQTIKFPDLSTFSTATHTIPLNDTDNTFTGTNIFTKDFSVYDEVSGYRSTLGYSALTLEDPVAHNTCILSPAGLVHKQMSSDGAITLHNTTLAFENAGLTATITVPNKPGTLALTSDIPSTSNFVTLSGAQTISGHKTFNNHISLHNGPDGYIELGGNWKFFGYSLNNGTGTSLSFPSGKNGTIALTSDIPIKTATLSGTTLSITLS